MLDEYRYIQQKRRRARRIDIHVPVGSLVCGLAVTYLFTAALVGFLAGHYVK